MQHKAKAQNALIQDVTQALEDGHIIPWFQPQISTDTGEVSGFEALARWHHPERGMIAPADFLPAIEQAGMFERLGEVILYHSLTCLKKWDKAGFRVPQVGVNFSDSELRNPKLVDKIRWELDRFDLSPDRLNVEILETVIAEAEDDVITRNIAGLATLGCAIDLDDFGTGHASISNIRRFAVERIKIDRSFMTKVDTDPEQQRMVSAIVTMAEQLNLKTLGEGVETAGEHAMLAQLGCTHVQGFGLGRPMPYADTLNWMQKHHEKLAETPKIGRGIG
jgi:EAL domain-containing protein (putative c-di-GMP-specific phosphodiesterase class I)